MLTIKNIQTIIGETYNEVFNIIGVKEEKWYYEFTLGYATVGKPNYEKILLHKTSRNLSLWVQACFI